MFSNAVKQLCFNASLFRGNCLELRTGAFVQYEKVLNAGVLRKNMCGDIIAWKTVVFRITSTSGVRYNSMETVVFRITSTSGVRYNSMENCGIQDYQHKWCEKFSRGKAE